MDISFLSLTVFFFSFLLLLLYKDIIFANASLGKKLLKIKLKSLDEQRLSFLLVLKRTIPLVLLPVEIVLIILNNKRIGDVWANTIVVEDS